MVSVNSVCTVIGITGDAISFFSLLSPLPTFMSIVNKRAVEQFSPMPYLVTLINCIMWVLYGLPIVHPNTYPVLTINCVGFLIQAVYIAIFFAFSPHHLRRKILGILAAEVVFLGAVLAGVFGGAHTQDKRMQIVGILCIIFGTARYASPLSVMKTVIQTKSVKYMPFSLSFVSFLSGVCWMTYSLLCFDLYILIPNSLGTLLGAGQLVLYCIYYRSSPGDEPKQNLELAEEVPDAPV